VVQLCHRRWLASLRIYMALNEAEVTAKIILPWLADLGFQPHEIHLETSFHLKAGRYTFRIDTEKQVEALAPRLDILVTRNGTNLLVIEAKGEEHEIDEQDAEQAISYACLVYPIAPFAAVLNGREARLYSTVSRKEILPGEFRIQDRYEVTLPEEETYKALRSFLTCSPSNLSAFCEKQVTEHMEALLGSKDAPYRKFIREIHSPRERFIQEIEAFLQSDDQVFALIGESGTGKTSALCDLTLRRVAQGKPVLFYSGLALESKILSAIQNDFAWAFSELGSPIQVIKRLEGIIQRDPLLIVIDAIDEWPHDTKVQHLADLARSLSGRPTKLLVSCKTISWDTFLHQRGTPTGLARYIYKEGESVGEHAGYRLATMTPREFHIAVDQYREFFEVWGAFETGVLEEARRSPFLLRILFEVARKSKQSHLTFSSTEFFEAYYRQVTEKTCQPELARVQLLGVARVLFEMNSDRVGADDLRGRLELRPNEILLHDLFYYNILSRSFSDDEEYIEFYFSKLRDYLVAFKILNWHKLSAEEFACTATALSQEGVHQEILSFYYRYAPVAQKRVLDGPSRDSLEGYVTFYAEVVNRHFNALKASFPPYVTGEIGIAAEFDTRKRELHWHGFRPLAAGEEKVMLLPTIDSERSNLLDLHGAEYPHRVVEPAIGSGMKHRVLREEIGRELENIVRKGLLDESGTPQLLQDSVLTIVHGCPQIFSPSRRHSAPPPNLPIDLDGLLWSVRYEKLYRHFMNERFDAKRREGLVEEHWEGSTVSYDATPSHEDVQWVDQRVRETMRQGIEPRIYGTSELDEIERRLQNAVTALKQQGISSITKHLFPLQSALQEASWRRFPISIEDAWSHVQRLFDLFYENYVLLVERNFPTLKDRFKLYSLMPITLFITVEKGRSGYDGEISVDFTACKAPPGVTRNEIIRREEREKGVPRGGVWHNGRLYQWLWSGGGGPLDNFLRSSRSYTNIRTKGSYRALLREKVYRKIEEELKAVQKGLLDLYGLGEDLNSP